MPNKKKIKVSFDFDDTLSKPVVQKFAGKLLQNDLLEVWIVTSRLDNESFDQKYGHGFKFNCNEDLFEVAEKLKIPESRIVFTQLEWKYLFFKDKDFAIHIDDLPQDIEYIRYTCNNRQLKIKSLHYLLYDKISTADFISTPLAEASDP